MKIAVVGTPNVGKSCIYNAVAGYKSMSSNFGGTTVRYEQSTVRVNGMVAELVDFPGCYSLVGTDEISLELGEYLLTQSVDVVINVVDASHLDRSLPLTLELLELGHPMVLALNMIDEAHAKGIEVDSEILADFLRVPVIDTIASRNVGIPELFQQVRNIYSKHRASEKRHIVTYSNEVESALQSLTREIVTSCPQCRMSSRFMAVKLLEGETELLQRVPGIHLNGIKQKVDVLRNNLMVNNNRPDTFMISERNVLARHIASSVTTQLETPPHWRERLDNVLLHPQWGYVILGLTLVAVFYFVFGVGAYLETPLLNLFHLLEELLLSKFSAQSITYTILNGALSGISGGIAIVLPYLVPFFLVLGFLEDVGYLPRVAFLMDTFMHKIGLHGTAIMPAIIGYGCTVPALFATRILPDKRDKILASVIATLVPCSARSVVIFGLVAFYLGAPAAIGIYILNIVVIVIAGKAMSALMPSLSPGMIMEMPPYRLPSLDTIVKKSWLRIREFVVIAWPLLIAGSVVLALAQYFHWVHWFNDVLSPLTIVLGLPAVLGTTLIFGVLRKELSLIMLVQAIGTTEVLTVLSAGQILTFTIFVTFYIPCLATLAVLYNELGLRWTLTVTGMTFGIATLLGVLTHLIFGGGIL